MKTIQDILLHSNPIKIIGDTAVSVNGISIDSKNIQDVFVCIKGTNFDSHTLIDEVIAKGTKVVVVESLPVNLAENITYIQVENSKKELGNIAAAFYNNPSKNFKLVGITGTNGKTTVATMLYNLFAALGYKCGLVSTVENKIADEIIPSTHTTPDAISLQKLLSQMASANCTHVFMEVSSHAVHQYRIQGAEFVGAVFTNITHDHLDYHKTFDEYIKAKKMFFDDLNKEAFAITNIDDKRGLVMLQNTVAHKLTYGLRTMCDFKGKILENNLSGLILDINNTEVHCRMIGEFNAYNILAVYGVAVSLEEEKQNVLQVLSNLLGAEGRFDYFISKKEEIIGIIDYAHTPDALINVLATINKLRKGNEVLHTVVGCGGDRDSAKRPLMALVASEHSDKVILTSDNPRSEKPETIIEQMEQGVPVHLKKKCISIVDRKEAIKTACMLANNNDIILVAGKGHEKYQDINGEKFPFDDKQILKQQLELLEK